MLITVSREFGAGGGDVARGLADRLGWAYADNELIQAVATRAGMSVAEVAEREERAPGFGERLARLLARAMPDVLATPESPDPEEADRRIATALESVVADLAAQGDVVLVGRAAAAVLAREREAVHVRITAPVAARAARVSVRLGLSIDDALRQLQDVDAQRARYHRERYGRDWRDSTLYDAVLNSERLGIAGAIDVVLAILAQHGRPA